MCQYVIQMGCALSFIDSNDHFNMEKDESKSYIPKF